MPSPINITELRRRNLREWINRLHQGRQIDFVSATGINQGELSALLKNKPFGQDFGDGGNGGGHGTGIPVGGLRGGCG